MDENSKLLSTYPGTALFENVECKKRKSEIPRAVEKKARLSFAEAAPYAAVPQKTKR
jgi:hypothetical protein